MLIIGFVYFSNNHGCTGVSRNSPAIGGLSAGSTAWLDQLDLDDNELVELKYGNVVLYRPPFAVENLYLGRVIGKPGDIIEIKDGILKRNNVEINESYLTGVGIIEIPQILVPKRTIYVLVDNRITSIKDSRIFGPVDVSSIAGRVRNVKE